jgi:hypothetical protein
VCSISGYYGIYIFRHFSIHDFKSVLCSISGYYGTYYECQSISNVSYFCSPLPFRKNQIQLHSLKTTTLTVNLSLFNIISVLFHRFGPPFNKALYSSPVRQRSVIESFPAEGEMPIRIHGRLKNVYWDAAVDVSTVRRWFIAVNKLKDKQGFLTSVRLWLRRHHLAFYRAGIHALFKRWTKTVEMDVDYI